MRKWMYRTPWLFSLILVAALMTVLIPVGNSLWFENLTIDGSITTQVQTPTPDAPTPTPIIYGCTYTLGYWKNHPDAWPVDSIGVGSISLSKSAAIDVLKLPTHGDATLILAQQLIPAKLNVLIGANPIAIGDTIQQADALLSQFPLGSSPQGGSRDSLIALSETLDAFNNGLLGPPHCGDNDEAVEDPTETPVPDALPLLTEPTPAPLGGVAPTATAIAPVVVDSPTPTETIVAQEPTNTPEPPTAMPPEVVPTDTPVPSVPPTATAVPALPPAPPPSGGEEPTPAPL